MRDLIYEHAVDERIKHAIRGAVTEMAHYQQFTETEREWCVEMVKKYEAIIALLVAAQQAGELIFG